MLSRNFRLQRVGNLKWLQLNYNFSKIAFYIDELIVLDVSRANRDQEKFCNTLRILSKDCFVPIAAGGGIKSIKYARDLLLSGADKLVINTLMFDDPKLLADLVKEFGQQCIVGSVDIKYDYEYGYQIFTQNGQRKIGNNANESIKYIPSELVGELYLNSIDRDGTGQGYDFETLKLIPDHWKMPIILAGGVGNYNHFVMGLQHPSVDATATAHLFNFVGDGLQKARENIHTAGLNLAKWPDFKDL